MPWLWGPQTPAKPNISWASFRAFFEASLNYMVFVRNKTYDGFADHDSRIFVINCPQKEAELWLKLTNKQADCFGRKATRVSWFPSAFQPATQSSAFGFWHSRSPALQNHSGENVAVIVLFNTPSGKPWKLSLKTTPASCPPKSTRIWWLSWKKNNFLNWSSPCATHSESNLSVNIIYVWTGCS